MQFADDERRSKRPSFRRRATPATANPSKSRKSQITQPLLRRVLNRANFSNDATLSTAKLKSRNPFNGKRLKTFSRLKKRERTAKLLQRKTSKPATAQTSTRLTASV
jgi:hypothetical protein